MQPPKYGSLNLNVRGMPVSATLRINEQCRALRAHGRLIFNFGLGQSPFPVPDPVVEALRNAAQEKDYLPVTGLPALREAVASFHQRHDEVNAHPDGVIVGPGSKELMFLTQLAFYGDILIPTPCWVSYVPQARIIGRQAHLLETTRQSSWKLTAEQLDDSLAAANDTNRPRLLVLNYPTNPTGVTYTTDELRDLAAIADRYGLLVLSDEIYGQLHHDAGHVSIARFYPERTILSSGLSKWCGAGGWRLGTFCFPTELNWLRDALASTASETFTSVSAPIQYAAVRAFQCGIDVERYLHHVRRVLKTLSARCRAILDGCGVEVVRPDGAFYFFLDFSPLRESLRKRRITDSVRLCEGLLADTGVAMLPGACFSQARHHLTARLSYVDFDGRRALAASERIPLHEPLPSGFLEQQCEHVLRGVTAVAEWTAGLS